MDDIDRYLMDDIAVDMTIQNLASEADDLEHATLTLDQIEKLASILFRLTDLVRRRVHPDADPRD